MPRKNREKFKSGRNYHVWNRGNRKQAIFFSEHDKIVFVRRFRMLAKRCQIQILVSCLMKNHFHFVLKQGNGANISKLMQRLIGSYSIYMNARHQLVGHTFQGRFKSREITTKTDLTNTVNYIITNPVNKHYTSHPFDYRWLYINKRLVEGQTLGGTDPSSSIPAVLQLYGDNPNHSPTNWHSEKNCISACRPTSGNRHQSASSASRHSPYRWDPCDQYWN